MAGREALSRSLLSTRSFRWVSQTFKGMKEPTSRWLAFISGRVTPYHVSFCHVVAQQQDMQHR